MQRVVHAIRKIARHEIGQLWNASLGVVKSVHGANGEKDYACTVELRETGIVLPKVPIATSVIGSVSLPRQNDLVLIVFAGGDLHAPVVVGRLYSEDVEPPTHAPGELVVVLPGDETSADERIELRVNTPGDGTRSLALTLDGSVKVSLTIGDEGIRLEAQEATLHLTQTSSSDGKAELTVGDSKVVIEQSGNVTIEAAATLKLKATTIEIEGDATVKIAGQSIALN
jgi:uncharacterized protein involved in type VI secretion and phage assembly